MNRTIDIPALRAYRRAVGRGTREIASGLAPEDLEQKTDPAKLRLVMEAGALRGAAVGIRGCWGRRTIAGMLLVSGSRHILTHLNEIFRSA